MNYVDPSGYCALKSGYKCPTNPKITTSHLNVNNSISAIPTTTPYVGTPTKSFTSSPTPTITGTATTTRTVPPKTPTGTSTPTSTVTPSATLTSTITSTSQASQTPAYTYVEPFTNGWAKTPTAGPTADFSIIEEAAGSCVTDPGCFDDTLKLIEKTVKDAIDEISPEMEDTTRRGGLGDNDNPFWDWMPPRELEFGPIGGPKLW